MSSQPTETLTADQAGIYRAAHLLTRGQLVAFPTETVYGLGADACDDIAVAGIFKAKQRPQFNPLIVHISDLDAARKIARFDNVALRLAATFWPGPLTLVLPLISGSGMSPLVSAGLQTVAIRVPAHPLARSLLARFNGPVAAPSANPSGKISPTQVSHVLAGLDGNIAAVLDGGPCPIGLESTIVGFLPDPVLLRPGGLSSELIEDCLGHALAVQGLQATPNSPGQLASHYAPNASMRLNATMRRDGETMLGFGRVDSDLNLSPASDLTEAAANLFHHLQQLDLWKVENIAVSPIPDHGLGRAINDRLQRAAAPRD